MTGRRFVLSSAVLTGPGTYAYELVTHNQARLWFDAVGWESAMRYSQSSDALALLLGVRVPVSRRFVAMNPGDEALVFRLKVPMSTVSPSQLRCPEYVARNAELGLLRRIV